MLQSVELDIRAHHGMLHDITFPSQGYFPPRKRRNLKRAKRRRAKPKPGGLSHTILIYTARQFFKRTKHRDTFLTQTYKTFSARKGFEITDRPNFHSIRTFRGGPIPQRQNKATINLIFRGSPFGNKKCIWEI